MNESRELKNAEQLEELLLQTEEIQEELEQKDQLIVELKTQLNESRILNEKLNKENRAGNIQALKNDLKLADRAEVLPTVRRSLILWIRSSISRPFSTCCSSSAIRCSVSVINCFRCSTFCQIPRNYFPRWKNRKRR